MSYHFVERFENGIDILDLKTDKLTDIYIGFTKPTNKWGGDMAWTRSPNRDKAFEIYKEHNGNITNREIANNINEDEKKVAVWKQRDKWNDELNVVQQKKQMLYNKEKTQ